MGQGQAGSTWTSNISAIHTIPLTKTSIQHALLVLVQHNMLYHVRIETDGTFYNPSEEKKKDKDGKDEELTGTEYFELNPSEIFPRVRFGWYLTVAEKTWGRKGKEVLGRILKYGKVKAGDLIDSFEEEERGIRAKENGQEEGGDLEEEEEEQLEEEEEEERRTRGKKGKGKSEAKEKEKEKPKGTKRKRVEMVQKIEGESKREVAKLPCQKVE